MGTKRLVPNLMDAELVEVELKDSNRLLGDCRILKLVLVNHVLKVSNDKSCIPLFIIDHNNFWSKIKKE